MACDDKPVCISAFYLRIRGREKYPYCVLVIFLCCHVLPVVSELDYSLLEHVVINNDFEFCLRDMSRQGGSSLFCYLIGTSTVLITVQY